MRHVPFLDVNALADLNSEIPSNMILDKFNRPSVFMGTIVLAWGLVVMCTGFVQNFAGLCVTRVFLGLFE